MISDPVSCSFALYVPSRTSFQGHMIDCCVCRTKTMIPPTCFIKVHWMLFHLWLILCPSVFLSFQEIMVKHTILSSRYPASKHFIFSKIFADRRGSFQLFLKGHRDICRWGQVASVQLTTYFYLVWKLQISEAVPHSLTHLHCVQKGKFTYIFKHDIRPRKSVGQVSDTVSEFNGNWKVPTVPVKPLCSTVHGNQPKRF
jgi:hypothetical protein